MSFYGIGFCFTLHALGKKYFYTLKWTIFFIQYNGQYFVTL